MDTMDWKLEIKLVGPEGTQREELFLGRDAHDLAMLGAAQGYVGGLYKAAEPAALLTGFEGMAAAMQKILNPPPPGPRMARVSDTQVVSVEGGILEITGTDREVVARAAQLLSATTGDMLKEVLDRERQEILLLIGEAISRGRITPEDLAELAGRPA